MLPTQHAGLTSAGLTQQYLMSDTY